MAIALIAFGSNLGDGSAILQMARDALNGFQGLTVASQSRPYVTQPVGGPAGQGSFVNAAFRVETSLSPEELHACLRTTESRLGRERRERWSARLVDLDLLLFDDIVRQSPQLTIPHPRMAFRRFVLEPAAEVAGDLRHPLIGWTVRQLLDHLNRAINYMALTGLPGCGKTGLARKTAQSTGARWINDPAADSADQDIVTLGDREAAILCQRAAILARENWLAEQPTVSDFWIGQSLVHAAVSQTGDADERLEELWQQLQPQIVDPKLLVWLRAEPRDVAWREALLRYHRGPLLELDASQPDWALHELTAALQAMQ